MVVMSIAESSGKMASPMHLNTVVFKSPLVFCILEGMKELSDTKLQHDTPH